MHRQKLKSCFRVASWTVALLLCGEIAQAADTDVRPAWARNWDALSKSAYMSRPDADFDGINDDEEGIGNILWGAVAGAAANWVEDGAGATIVATADSDLPHESDLPFNLPWRAGSSSQIWIGRDGIVGLSAALPVGTPKALPLDNLGSLSFLCVYWQRLAFSSANESKIWTAAPDGDTFVVTWQDMQVAGEAETRVTFQLELRSDGEMVWRYRELESVGSGQAPIVGIQSDGRGWWVSGTELEAPLALRIAALPGLDPNNPDTDGDGIPDGMELYYYQPDHPLGHSLDPRVADNPGDIDRDGLDVIQEYLHGPLDPFYWDTDGDMLSDGYEVSVRLLADDASGIHGLYGDGDDDGLNNYEERLYRTQPRLADSDGDGIDDAEEIVRGSNPAGPGSLPSTEWLAPVRLTLGGLDVAGKTEAYEMFIDPIAGDTRGFTFQNTTYGEVQTEEIELAIGGEYALRLRHMGSVRASDGMVKLDYNAGIEGIDGTRLSLSGDLDLLGTHIAAGKISGAIEPINTNRQVIVKVWSRELPDGSIPIVDPALGVHLSAWPAGVVSATPPVSGTGLTDPGILALPIDTAALGNLAVAKVRFPALAANVSATRWIRFSNTSKLGYRLPNMSNPAMPVGNTIKLSDNISSQIDVEFVSVGSWLPSETVTIELIIRDSSNNTLAIGPKVRFFGSAVAVVGDSISYGFRRRTDGTHEMPLWPKPWLSYPTPSDWNGFPGNYYDVAYQGFRGYLKQSIVSEIAWLGHNANGHGPDHCGFPGARTYDIISTVNDTSRHYPSDALTTGPNELILIYFIGINDINGRYTSSQIYNNWIQGLNDILAKRVGKGRTIVVAATLPPVSSKYANYTSSGERELRKLNTKIRAHVVGKPNVRYVVADFEGIGHDSDDDGLHFMANGHNRMAQILRQAIINGLKQKP